MARGFDEVEVVMQAFASIRPQEGAMRVLVMTGLVGVAGFHRRDDMHQAGTVATDDKHLATAVLSTSRAIGFSRREDRSRVTPLRPCGDPRLRGAAAHWMRISPCLSTC